MDYIPQGKEVEAAKGPEAKMGLQSQLANKVPQAAIQTIYFQHFPIQCRSLANNLDELKLQIATKMIVRDSCILLIMATWLQVRTLLKERNKAFRCGDGAQYNAARASLRRGIREAKTAYQSRIEEHLSSRNTQQVWQGVQHIAGYKSNNLAVADRDASLVE